MECVFRIIQQNCLSSTVRLNSVIVSSHILDKSPTSNQTIRNDSLNQFMMFFSYENDYN